MTATYDLTTDGGKIRLAIGDTNLSKVHFSDEELAYFLSSEGSVNLAAAAALESWAASSKSEMDSEHIGDYSYSRRTAATLLDMAARLRSKEAQTVALTPVMDWAEMDLKDYAE